MQPLLISTLLRLAPVLALVHLIRAQVDPGSDDDSATCPTQSGYFDQLIDHSQHSSGHTFKHQYRLNMTFFKEGGPILLYQSAELATLTCPDGLILTEWAQDLGGITAALEHRYFGLSLPFGNDSYARKNLQHFTLENVMADAVAFVDFVKKNVTGADNSKVVVAGGSYGGFLSAAFRQNHPDAFFGALSVAGPFSAFGDADEAGSDRFNWYNYVQNTYARRSLDAFARIKAALAQVVSWLDTGNASMVQSSLSLCAAPSNASSDRDSLISWYTNAYTNLAQINHLPGTFYNVTGTLDTIINDTLSASSPIAALNQTLWHAYGQLAQNGCLNYTTMVGSSIGLQDIHWSWANCKWVPLNLDISPTSIFGQGLSSFMIKSSVCAKLFNTTQNTGAEIRSKFQLSRQDFANSTRIIFGVGEYDPTTAVAVPQSWLGDGVSTDMHKSVVIMINGVGHTQDIEPSTLDPPSVVEAREVELNIIKGWLNVSDAAEDFEHRLFWTVLCSHAYRTSEAGRRSADQETVHAFYVHM